MPLDGTTTFGGVIDDLTISYLPRNTPFILKYDGGKPMKYNIYDYRN